MITVILNGFLILEHLSKIKLYYTPPSLIKEKEILLRDDEFHHCVNVMRNSIGGIIFITDGEGKLYESEIRSIMDKELISRIIKASIFENKSKDIWFCIPSLKNPDRLKFAFEKCVELGITNFILFSSKNIVAKKLKPEKFLKTTLSAMKQSLRTFLPKIVSADFNDILQLPGTKIIFEQNSEKLFNGDLTFNKPIYFLFGPEGGFDEHEIQAADSENIFSLSANRLRSETAIIKCASILKY